jgi:hypothetical protein
MLRVLAVCIVAASGVSPPDEAQKLSDEFHEFVDDSLDTWSVMPDYFKRSQALKQRVPADALMATMTVMDAIVLGLRKARKAMPLFGTLSESTGRMLKFVEAFSDEFILNGFAVLEWYRATGDSVENYVIMEGFMDQFVTDAYIFNSQAAIAIKNLQADTGVQAPHMPMAPSVTEPAIEATHSLADIPGEAGD